LSQDVWKESQNVSSVDWWKLREPEVSFGISDVVSGTASGLLDKYGLRIAWEGAVVLTG